MNDNVRKIINLHDGIDFNTELRYKNAMNAFDTAMGSLIKNIEELTSSVDISSLSDAYQNFKTEIERKENLHSIKSISSSDFKAENQSLTQSTEIIYGIVNELSKTQQHIAKIKEKNQSSLSEEEVSEIDVMIKSCVKVINDSIPAQGKERLRKSSGERSL